jgi:uncharacterized protein (TIGR03435 family)
MRRVGHVIWLLAAASGLAGPAVTGVWAQGAAKPAMMAKDADPGWEVASIRPSDPNARNDKFDVIGRHVIVQNQTVEIMLMMSYGLQKSQIVGVPDWVKTERYDVDGVPDVEGQPDVAQFQGMVRKLLAERFGLKMHMEQREMEVYALTVAKGGAKMEKSVGNPDETMNEDARNGDGQRQLMFTNTSMKDLALLMLVEVDRPVVNHTGLDGRYNFKLSYTKDESRAPTDGSAAPNLFTAIQEQAGLKLEAVKAPAPVLVVDAVQRPTAN